MRRTIVLFIIFLCVASTSALAQKSKPKPKSAPKAAPKSAPKSAPKATAPPASDEPPPPPPPPPPTDDGGGAGFKTYTIPVYDRIQLGMLKADFEQLAPTLNSFVTDNSIYTARYIPGYQEERLFTLLISIRADSLKALPTDIFSKFKSKYGEADSFRIVGENERAKEDSGKGGQVYAEWKFPYYNLVMDMNIARNGDIEVDMTYKTEIRILYRGNNDYSELLKEVDKRKDNQ